MGVEGGSKLSYARRHFDDKDLEALPLREGKYPYEEVDFSQNGLSAEGLAKVLDLCSRCAKLRKLSLYKNDIGDHGAQALASFIKRCSSIEEMHLSHNGFTARGVEAIVSAANQTREKGMNPLWLRLEQNEVADAESVLRDLCSRYSVCARMNKAKCTVRNCMDNRKVHLPFFLFQKGGRQNGAWEEQERGGAANRKKRKRKENGWKDDWPQQGWKGGGRGAQWIGGKNGDGRWRGAEDSGPQRWREGESGDEVDRRGRRGRRRVVKQELSPEDDAPLSVDVDGPPVKRVKMKAGHLGRAAVGGMFLRTIAAVQRSAQTEQMEIDESRARARPVSNQAAKPAKRGILTPASRVKLQEAPRAKVEEADGDEEQDAEEEEDDEGDDAEQEDEAEAESGSAASASAPPRREASPVRKRGGKDDRRDRHAAQRWGSRGGDNGRARSNGRRRQRDARARSRSRSRRRRPSRRSPVRSRSRSRAAAAAKALRGTEARARGERAPSRRRQGDAKKAKEDRKREEEESPAPAEFRVTLEKTPSRGSLGIDIKRVDAVSLLIDRVNAGLVAEHNANASSRYQIRPGDRIVSCNSVRGNATSIFDACKRDKVLKLRIQRPEAPERAARERAGDRAQKAVEELRTKGRDDEVRRAAAETAAAKQPVQVVAARPKTAPRPRPPQPASEARATPAAPQKPAAAAAGAAAGQDDQSEYTSYTDASEYEDAEESEEENEADAAEESPAQAKPAARR